MKTITLTSGLTIAPADLMALAAALQGRYEDMGVPATQNVRNPIPAKHLILQAFVGRTKSNPISFEELKAEIESRYMRITEQYLRSSLWKLTSEGTVKVKYVRAKAFVRGNPTRSMYFL